MICAVVEDVAINRQPLSKLEAIYFLTTSDESIDFLIRDFDPNVKKKLMYAEVHIFFTTSNYCTTPSQHLFVAC